LHNRYDFDAKVAGFSFLCNVGFVNGGFEFVDGR